MYTGLTSPSIVLHATSCRQVGGPAAARPWTQGVGGGITAGGGKKIVVDDVACGAIAGNVKQE